MAVFQNSNRNITTTVANGTGTLSVVGNLWTSANAYIAGDLTVDGNVTYINITELNVQDPIISLGRGPNNTPLGANDGKDRGENLWYYTTQEKSAFIGYKNSTGNLFAATNVTITNEVVSVNNYGNFVVGGLISDTVIANVSIATYDATVANTITAERVSANVLETSFVYGNLIGNVFTVEDNILMVDGVTNSLYANLAEIHLVRGDFEGSVFAEDSSTFFDAIDNAMYVGTASVAGNITADIVRSTNNGNGTNFKVGDDVWIGDVNASDTMIVKGQQNAANGYIIFGNSDNSQYLGRSGTGPLTYTGNISAAGNITANYYFGNGALLTGVSAASANAETLSGSYLPNNITSSNLTALGTVISLSVTGNVNSGNVNASFYYGNGSQLTGVTASSANAESLTGAFLAQNVTSSNLTALGTVVSLSVSGNINSGNILTAGIVSSTGNVIAGNVLSNGLLSATGNATVGNLLTAGLISAQGNITGGNLLTAGLISATGNVTAGNLNTSGMLSTSGNIGANNVSIGSYLNGNIISASGNITGSNILTGGLVSAAGNLVSGNLSTAGLITVTGNATVGNLLTAGLISAQGNITGGNLNTAGSISTTGNIAANNISVSSYLNGNIVSATGNITGANFLSAGVVSASSNITGSNLLAGGIVSVTGNASAGNISTANLISAGGNVTSAANVSANNINATNWVTGANISASGNSFVGGYLSVVGNLYVANIVASSNLVVQDPLVYLTANSTYPYNYDIGLYSQFTGGPGNTYQHTGFVRDYTDNTWKLFSNVGEPTGSAIDFANVVYDPLRTGNITADSGAFSGLVSATGNVIAGNVRTAGLVTATGNVTAGNIDTAGLISAQGNITGGNLAGTTLTVTNIRTTGTTGTTLDIRGGVQNTANAAGGAITLAAQAGNGTGAGGAVTVTSGAGGTDATGATGGNISLTPGSGGQFGGAGGSLNLNAGSTSGAGFGGNIIVGGAPTATGVGGNITITGGLAFGTDKSGGQILIKSGAGTGAGVVSNVVIQTPTVGSTGTTAQTLADRAVFSSTGLSVAGNVTGGNILASGLISATSNIITNAQIQSSAFTGGNISWTANNVTDFQGSIKVGQNIIKSGGGATSITLNNNGANIGILGVTSATNATSTTTGALIVSGGTGIAGNIYVGGLASVAGNITGANLITGGLITASGNITGSYIFGNGSQLTGMYGDSNVGSLLAAFGSNTISTTGAVTTGNITAGNISTAGTLSINSITHTGTNATGDIGGTSSWFGTIYATAAEALYADLAEKYSADADYAPGTVVSFGGSQEVTLSSADGDRRIAGIISKNPSYTMNAGLESEFVATVALQGRVPCLVQGQVRKGDMMVSAGNGCARAENEPKVGTVLGKSLEDFDGDNGIIEVAVGRL